MVEQRSRDHAQKHAATRGGARERWRLSGRLHWQAAALALLVAAALGPGCGSTQAAAPHSNPLPAGTPIDGWQGRLTTYAIQSTVQGIVSRNVTVLLPPGYADAANANVRYPVFYMHDGNNCLDHDPFGHGGWQVPAVSTDLINRGVMAPVIFVLIDNSPSRTDEFNPGSGRLPGATADGYLDFVEKTVVPLIDDAFRTRATASARGIGGSSFGAVISLYAGWTRAQTFGVVLSMSGAFWVYDFPQRQVATATAKKPLRIYLDSGTTDYSGGNDGLNDTIHLRDLLAGLGWVLGQDLQHFVGQGDSHDESAWRSRLPIALPFLFPPAH